MDIYRFLPLHNSSTICVIGLGYVGLPLSLEISYQKGDIRNNRRVVGYDIDKTRIEELNKKFDRTKEVKSEELEKTNRIIFTSNEELLKDGDIFIVTTPTPIDDSKKPDLTLLCLACKKIGKALKDRIYDVSRNKIPIIIFESTVYPGVTEEICVPIIEKESGLKFNSSKTKNCFVVGYSPERINPGDNKRKLTNIKKIVSGSTREVGQWINDFYSSFIEAGTYLTPSIKVAEAAKVIENTQRDLNIALINELAIIFKKMDIDTLEVLKAAETKWNFIPFRPGLVGGHCIGVDPYYLTYIAEKIGYHPQVILAGRRINDFMPSWFVEQIVINLCKKRKIINGSKILVLGLTFKEDCPDFRNSKVFDLIKGLREYGLLTTIYDPYVNENIRKKFVNYKFINSLKEASKYNAVIVAVSHKVFRKLPVKTWQNFLTEDGIIFDIKGIVPIETSPVRF